MVISKTRHYVCISLGKKTVCLQINAEVSSALHQLCPPKQPVKAACEVCEGADSDEPQQCTCKCVFLLTTCIFYTNICCTKILHWLHDVISCKDCSMIIHKTCCGSAPLCLNVSVCVNTWLFTYKSTWNYINLKDCNCIYFYNPESSSGTSEMQWLFNFTMWESQSCYSGIIMEPTNQPCHAVLMWSCMFH